MFDDWANDMAQRIENWWSGIEVMITNSRLFKIFDHLNDRFDDVRALFGFDFGSGGRTGWGRGPGATAPVNVNQSNTFHVPDANVAKIAANLAADALSREMENTSRKLSANPNGGQ